MMQSNTVGSFEKAKSARRVLRGLFEKGGLIVASGAYDAFSAMLAEKAGLPAVCIGGAAMAASDGFTLLLATSNHVINPRVYKSAPYDAVTGVTPLNVVGEVPSLLVVRSDFKASSVEELTQMLKSSDEYVEGSLPGTFSGLCCVAIVYKQA